MDSMVKYESNLAVRDFFSISISMRGEGEEVT